MGTKKVLCKDCVHCLIYNEDSKEFKTKDINGIESTWFGMEGGFCGKSFVTVNGVVECDIYEKKEWFHENKEGKMSEAPLIVQSSKKPEGMNEDFVLRLVGMLKAEPTVKDILK